MELLIVILLLIIGLLTFLLLKKERVLGINHETTNKNTEVKIVESKEYRKNIFDLLYVVVLLQSINGLPQRDFYWVDKANKLFGKVLEF